jgi:hypothetical protein
MVPGAEMRVRPRGVYTGFRAGQGCHPGMRVDAGHILAWIDLRERVALRYA